MNASLRAAACLLCAWTLSACGDVSGDDVRRVGEPALRIVSGDVESDGFGTVADLALGGDGAIYSVHPREAVVRAWSPEGEPMRTLGGLGEEPGQFRVPVSAGFVGDSLWVLDAVLGRVSWYDGEGLLRGTAEARPDLGGGGRTPSRPVLPVGDGTWVGEPSAPSALIVSGAVESGAWVRLSAAGEVLDTIYVSALGSEGILSIRHEEGVSTSVQPFGDDPLVTADPWGGGVVVVERAATPEAPGRVWVARLGVAGDTAWSRELRLDTVALTDARVDSTVSVLAGRLQATLDQRSPEELRRAVGEALYRPPWLPAVTAVLAGRDGTIWLGLPAGGSGGGMGPSVPERDGGGASGAPRSAGVRLWRVLAEDGSELATVELPAAFRPLEAWDSHVWGTSPGEDGAPSIAGYAVELRR